MSWGHARKTRPCGRSLASTSFGFRGKTHPVTRKLLVSFKTLKEVTKSTIARWLQCVLVLAGIDTTIFKAHSYRAATTSAAYHAGISLECILKTAD
jgi:hypothetical protein